MKGNEKTLGLTFWELYFHNLQSGGSVGSIVDDKDVVGACVVETGFASGGAKTHSSKYLNSTSSIATNPFPLLLRCTRSFICQINGTFLRNCVYYSLKRM